MEKELETIIRGILYDGIDNQYVNDDQITAIVLLLKRTINSHVIVMHGIIQTIDREFYRRFVEILTELKSDVDKVG